MRGHRHNPQDGGCYYLMRKRQLEAIRLENLRRQSLARQYLGQGQHQQKHTSHESWLMRTLKWYAKHW